MVQNIGVGINISLIVVNYNVSVTIPGDKTILHAFGALGQHKAKENESLESYLARFNMVLARVTYTLDEGLLAHITSGVLPESKL